MTLKDIYESTLKTPTNWDEIHQNLAEFTTSKYFPALKLLLEGMIGDVLTQADDIKKVHDGQMDLEAYGQRAYIARVVADKMQSIIDLLERTHESLGGEDGESVL